MFGGENPRKLVRTMMQFKNVREVKDLQIGNSYPPDGRDCGPLIDRDLDLTDFGGVQEVRTILRKDAYDNFPRPEKRDGG